MAANLSNGLSSLAGSAVSFNDKSAALASLTTAAPNGVSASGVQTVMRNGTEYVVIDAISALGAHDRLLGDLEALGLESGEQFGRVVSGLLPVDAVADLLTVGSLQSVSSGAAQTNVGSVTTQDDAATQSDVARATYDVDGTGVTVGILSDSFDTSPFFAISAADDVASGDLPDDVLILEDFVDPINGTIDEGRGMAQLVHDLAPGADIQFATAFGGQANFANNILALRDAGSTVIVDDIIYFAEPAFADGIIAQAAAEVVADGVPYFSSAGNNSNAGYQSPFVDSGIPGFFDFIAPAGSTTHDWDPGAGVDPVLDFTLDTGITRFILQWDDPYASTGLASPGAATDLDIWLTAPGTDPTAIFFGSTDINVGGDPVEVFSINNPGAPVELGLAIELFEGALPSDMRIIAFDPNDFVDAEYDFFGPTVYGHAAAEGALGVGAADWDETPEFGVTPPLLESFSSFGPVEILFDTDGNRLATPDDRDAVDFVASQGGNTTFFISDTPDDPDTFPNFFGTSASAPNAAAIAALVLERNPGLTPAEVEAILEGSAIDMDNPFTPGFDVGEDDATGAGFILADIAVRSAVADKVDPNLVRFNDWFREESGTGGYNATFSLTLTDELVDGAGVESWVLDVDVMNDDAEFVTGWLDGFNGPVDFDRDTGVFSTVGQGFQPTLEVGDTLTFSVQVNGAGFDEDEIMVFFADLDDAPVTPPAAEVDVDASSLNVWNSGFVQRVDVENVGDEMVDGWIVKLDLDPGEINDFTINNAWNAVAETDGEDWFFFAKSYNQELDPGESIEFGFQAARVGGAPVPYDASDFSFVDVADVPVGVDIPDNFDFV